ncbi:pyruvate dehydrogenase E2 component (dihydrolipoamide acetyltransferase) [Kaistia hirudinis]|uniref:Pyruvate dehydrogenase E2 component (Dihydrolipoamide acetyltransferase) n=1 Tax=Kaistia hirudinis TaxID=1293440 RepID=A0A840ARK3_9HYPH|nr:E3 binding domain-containing protein [Kaistia hirudinis]MBB3931657.1 pyruvate dehydrogenase E2 component (dihydrolipoamide acetyltransferase) [Kaistia hirudinis]
MSAAASRRAASPYARRLARERGIALAELAGTGPRGRIVAADIPLQLVAAPEPAAAVPAPAPVATAPSAPAPVAVAARAFGAFATNLALGPLRELIAAAGVDVPLHAFLARAAAQATGRYAEAIRLVAADGRSVAVAGPARLAPSEIACRFEAGEGASAERPLVLTHLAVSGIRPVAGSLAPDCDLRILVVAAPGTETGEALLVHDSDAVSEAEAATMLAAFRDALENPLRLLV